MNAEERKVIAALYWELKDGNVSDFLSSGIGELTARGNTDLIADAQVQLRRHRDKLMALLDNAEPPCDKCPHSETSHEHIGGLRPWVCHECDDGSASIENRKRSYYAAIRART